eukprot:1300034-Pyramimonas_sp.AAC.1
MASVHSLSLAPRARDVAGAWAMWPARGHFCLACACAQSRMPARSASNRHLRVAPRVGRSPEAARAPQR